jgi:hypothetical protein
MTDQVLNYLAKARLLALPVLPLLLLTAGSSPSTAAAYRVAPDSIICQSFSSNYSQEGNSSDLLPPSLGQSGAKVQPTVVPPGAQQGHGGRGAYGHSHHHHRWSGGGNFGNPHFNHGYGMNHGAQQYQNPVHELPTESNIKTWNSNTATSSPSTKTQTEASRKAADQASELEQKYEQEAEQKIQMIRDESAKRRRDIQDQISSQQQSTNGGNHGYGGRGRHGRGGNYRQTNSQNDYLQRQMQAESDSEERQIRSVQAQLAEKQKAIRTASLNFAAHLNTPSGSNESRFAATKNDLHVQNYEIKDSPTGEDVPLMATPKKLDTK